MTDNSLDYRRQNKLTPSVFTKTTSVPMTEDTVGRELLWGFKGRDLFSCSVRSVHATVTITSSFSTLKNANFLLLAFTEGLPQ